MAVDTTATIVATTPEENNKKSEAPLNGKFTFACEDKTLGAGVTFTSPEIWRDASMASIHNSVSTIPFMGDNMWIYESSSVYDYNENGRSFVIDFHDLDKEPPLCTIQGGVTTPMTGTPSLEFKSESLATFGTTLWWDTIPLEFLRTAREMPQVAVSVNGIQALCTENNCDFKYIAPEGVITSFAYDSATNEISVVGTALPVTGTVTLEWDSAGA